MAATLYAAGGLFMKLSDGLRQPAAAVAFSSCFLAGAFLQALGMKRYDLGAASVLVVGLEGVMAVLFGLVILGEALTAARAVAIVIVLVGAGLLSRT